MSRSSCGELASIHVQVLGNTVGLLSAVLPDKFRDICHTAPCATTTDAAVTPEYTIYVVTSLKGVYYI